MATLQKYANLPDLDNSPDVYETPDLADDVSTIQATTATSPTASSYDDAVESVTDDRSGIDRSKFQPNDARTRFRPSRVDARGVDFSDRAIGAHRSYRTSSRRQRRSLDDDQEEYGDWSDEEDEGLERKIARLGREVEEVKLEVLKRGSVPLKGETEQENDTAANLDQISEALDAVYASRHGGPNGAETDFSKLAAKFDQETSQTPMVPLAKTAPPPSVSLTNPQLAQALQKAAEFDMRLAFLESALGLDSSTIPEQASNPPKPIFYTLQTMAQKIQTLSDTSSSIDAAATKARKATQDFERLHMFRRTLEDENYSKPAAAELEEARKAEGYIDDAKRVTKINALYGALPTIDSFAPILPMVLERLRTLRSLHGTAAAASGTLDEIEKRQNEQAIEIQQWREALQNVEASLKEGKGSLAENVANVGQWVKDLEVRVARFG